MIRTQIFPRRLPQRKADALTRESGRIYSGVMVEYYRVFRHTGHWLSPRAGEKINDSLSGTILHAHSRDAAQQGFYKACKTARANRGLAGSRYPHRCKTFRTTIWKNTGIRKKDGILLLSLVRGNAPIHVSLPFHLVALPGDSFLEMRLVWECASKRYSWHRVIEDGSLPAESPGKGIAAVDLGEIHPGSVTDGEEGVVFAARELRSLSQYTYKRLAELNSKLSKKERYSRRYQRIMARKARFLGKQSNKRRDIEHKVSRAVVDWAVERGVETLVIGDVRDAADQIALGKGSNQKISSWSHGKIRTYIEYKSEAAGIQTALVDEHHTSQTCPQCGHRDIVGAVNILSRYTHGEVGRLIPP